MIVSASRRTDIPAFFAQWFMNRVNGGYFYAANPFNPRQVKGYSLLPEDVDAIVFWSKNPRPLMKHLDVLDSRGYRYYFQFTLNDYPSILEPHIPSFSNRLQTFKELSSRLGPARVIWRWDPIVISSVTPAEYHLQHIEKAAQALQGCSARLVISFLDFYGKVADRLERLTRRTGIVFRDLTLPEHRGELLNLAGRIREIGDKYGFGVYSCAEAVDLTEAGIPHGACIDGDLIRRLFGIKKKMRKDRGQRPECLCAESVDVGVYNTCSHGCAYCYANFSEQSIRRNLAKQVPGSPLLIGTYEGHVEIVQEPRNRPGARQPALFE
ncbi:MAG: DUF1848 domain-containing protein [Firmicutes bacterium]|nr:DUF1848 domain-containing protein [Bacillota bacterium]